MTISSIIFLAACFVIAYSGFCRLAHVDMGTRTKIRVAVYLATVASIWSGAAVLLWGYRPGWPAAAMAGSMMALLLATSTAWRHGVPAAYRRHAQ